MKALSPSECSVWLKREGCSEDPYGGKEFSPASYLQFAISRDQGGASHVVDGVRTFLRSPRTCLFQVTDWSRYGELENSKLEELESRSSGNLFNAWGIEFAAIEADEMFECCFTVVDCGMSAYLYVPRSATVYFWEGDLVDVWTNDPAMRKQLAQWLESEQFRITSS